MGRRKAGAQRSGKKLTCPGNPTMMFQWGKPRFSCWGKVGWGTAVWRSLVYEFCRLEQTVLAALTQGGDL